MTGFEDDEHFFASYDPEQAALSQGPIEFDEVEPPSQEQLAHWARFRMPVGLFVSALAFLPIVGLGKRASQREFVAHYGAAIPATSSTARALAARAAVVPAASSAANPSALALSVRGFSPAFDAAPSDLAAADVFSLFDSNSAAVCLLTPKSPTSNP